MIGLAEHATKTTTPKSNRLADAVQLRDVAIKFVQANGAWKPFSADTRVMQFDSDSLSVWYSVFPFGFGIDIWDASRKVFNVQWNDTGIDIISFRRGDWENRLIDESETSDRQKAA
jgi:hypothetical protein